MRRKISIFFLLAALVLTLCACAKTAGAQRTIHSLGGHTTREVEAAMDLATAQFAAGFPGCILKTMTYDGQEAQKAEAAWAEQYDADDALVLESSFFTTPRTDGSLTPNRLYSGYQWILTRTGHGPWTLRTWGYG